MTPLSLHDVRTLLEAPSPAVLTVTRADGTAMTTPVWFRWTGRAFEAVIAINDGKLRNLESDPHCSLLIFETVAPFRGVEIRGVAALTPCDVSEVRRSIAIRYLGAETGKRFATERASTPGVLFQLVPDAPRVWSLAGILPVPEDAIAPAPGDLAALAVAG
jgi:hypothetical protein